MRNRIKLFRAGAVVAALATLAVAGTAIYADRVCDNGDAAVCETWFATGQGLVERAYRKLFAGNAQDRGRAVALFRLAVERDPQNAYRWCDLGEALLATGGNGAEAERCFRRAVTLAPNVPPILFRAANFWFRSGESTRALPYTARILAIVPDFDAAIFDTFRRMEVDPKEVLRLGIPPEARVAKSFVRYLAVNDLTEEARLLWQWARQHSVADAAFADQYAGLLVRNRAYGEAADAWQALTQTQEPGYRDANQLFNGGFERDSQGTIFDWRIIKCDGVEAQRDSSVYDEGRASLRLHFLGTQNPGFAHVSQKMALAPGRYTLTARFRTEGLTTDQGVGLRVRDIETPAPLAISERLTGTCGWTTLESDFEVRGGVRLVEVQIVRDPSWKFDNKIAGMVWVDNVVIRRQGDRPWRSFQSATKQRSKRNSVPSENP